MTEQVPPDSILVAASGFIYAPTSGNNLGDRAQLSHSVERLRAAFPAARLVAVANSINDEARVDDLDVSYSAIRYLTSPVETRGGGLRVPTEIARALRIFLLVGNARRVAGNRKPIFLSPIGRGALREMEESSALFISGAGAFNDLYVSSVGGFWGVLVRCMSVLGKPVVASGQQIGPLNRFKQRALVRWALYPVDFLGVRDPRSKDVASAVGVPAGRIVLTGDDAWDLAPATSAVAQATLQREGISEPFIAAQMRFGGSVGWDVSDSPAFAATLSQLSSELGMPVVFVPCMTSRGNDDRYAAARVRQDLDVPSWALTEELDARTTKAVLGRAVLAVGTANHFCVFAASMGTPVIGLYATPYMEQKLRGIAELWPGRMTALSKEEGLRSVSVLAAARRLLERQVDTGEDGENDQSSVELKSGEPMSVLARLLAQTPPQPYSARFVESRSVEVYEREFRPGGFMRNVSHLECLAVRSLLEKYGRTPFERHLDFACGTGRAIGFVEGYAETTVGMDVSAAMLDQAHKRFPRVRFVAGDVSTDSHLLEQIGPFDLVTMWRFLAPAEPPLRLAALSAVARSMSDGGLLIVNNNANRTSLHWIALLLRSLVRAQPFRSSAPYRDSLSSRQLSCLLEDVGLRVEETRGICYLPELLTRRVSARLWMPLEQALGRLNMAPRYAVNQVIVARRPGHADDVGAAGRAKSDLGSRERSGSRGRLGLGRTDCERSARNTWLRIKTSQGLW